MVRVPAYSPYAVAEHAMALLLTLNRKTHKAYNRTKENNFMLDGLLGFDLYNKTVGLIGFGKIGGCFANICKGFGMKVICYDLFPSKQLEDQFGIKFVSLEEIYKQSDVISLHCPLTPQTKYIINENSIKQMKSNCIIINTGRGLLVDSKSAITALK